MTNHKDNQSKRTSKKNEKFRVIFSILTVVLLIITGCNGTSVITMTTESDEVKIYVSGSGKFTIDWGDGTVENGTLLAIDEHRDGYVNLYSHNYSISSSHIITITGENITHLDCSDNQLTRLDVRKNAALNLLWCSHNQLTSLDLSKNTALTHLHCGYNQLTRLDLRKNTALMILACWGNQLNAIGLNNLFKTLNGNAGEKRIFIANNPGTSDCNWSIAEEKGWTIWVIEFFSHYSG